MDHRNGDDASVTNGGEKPTVNKRKRKCVADDRNAENHYPTKRSNTRKDNYVAHPVPSTSSSRPSTSYNHGASTSFASNASTSSRANGGDLSSTFYLNGDATVNDDGPSTSHASRPSTSASLNNSQPDPSQNSNTHPHPHSVAASTHHPYHISNHPPSVATTHSDDQSSDSSSVPPSDFDLASPPSIGSIVSPIAESVPSPAPALKKKTPIRKKDYIKLSTVEQLPCYLTPSVDQRLCPLPALSWAEAGDVWKLMCRKDSRASLERDARCIMAHPGIQPRMRAILLDWLIEVCEVYKLHRETYYLAVDYLDRYLSATIKVSKTRLQLIGITCLFVAAKVEEIYPPKIGEFAYVTDGACQEDDIVQQELLLLTTLKWSTSPVTIIGWLSVYMQLNCSNRTPKSLNSLVNSSFSSGNSGNNSCSSSSNDSNNIKNSSSSPRVKKGTYVVNNPDERGSGTAFVYPQFSGLEFVQTARLIDLCTLDIGLTKFSYSVIAAAALVFTIGRTSALRVSGLEWGILAPCVKWMEPFYVVLTEEPNEVFLLESMEQVKQTYGLNHICADITTDDSHIIQTHSTSLALFELAMIRAEEMTEAAILASKQQVSPAQTADPTHSCPAGLLTPPASNRKFPDANRADATSEPETLPPSSIY